mgnify:CR=1 FL=1
MTKKNKRICYVMVSGISLKRTEKPREKKNQISESVSLVVASLCVCYMLYV